MAEGSYPAGWYPDPAGVAQQRYWDGIRWTEHVSAANAEPPPFQYPAPVQYPAQYPVQPYYGPAPAAQYQVAPKSPGLCLLISFFVPGVGSMVAGNTGVGVLILVGYIVSLVLTLVLIGIVGVIGFWIWGMVDAYSSAQRWNLQHGIIS